MIVSDGQDAILIGLKEVTVARHQEALAAIGDHLSRGYRGWKVVLVAPDRKLIKKLPFKLDVLPFFHGGLKPALMFGRIAE